ncbi:MAG: hypothetical protein V9F00_04705 [Nocardioides sp.]
MKTYTFTQTVTGPARELEISDTAVPGQILVADGGGCDRYPIPQRVYVSVFDAAGGDPLLQRTAEVTQDGRWSSMSFDAVGMLRPLSVSAYCTTPSPTYEDDFSAYVYPQAWHG